MATVKRAETVSVAQLSKTIDKAIGLAAKRHAVVFENENIIHNWEILGRILREMNGPVGQARLDVASTVVKNLGPGFKARPVVTKIGKDVLVGFIERGGRSFNF
jgi:hypothetical protein